MQSSWNFWTVTVPRASD